MIECLHHATARAMILDAKHMVINVKYNFQKSKEPFRWANTVRKRLQDMAVSQKPFLLYNLGYVMLLYALHVFKKLSNWPDANDLAFYLSCSEIIGIRGGFTRLLVWWKLCHLFLIPLYEGYPSLQKNV